MPVERYEGVHLGTTPEEIEDEVERGPGDRPVHDEPLPVGTPAEGST